MVVGGGVGVWQWRKHVAASAVPRYDTVAVDRGPIVAKVTATGTLSALVTVQVGTQVSGRIKEIMVDFNSPVKKGQVIAKIDPPLFAAALEQARANYLAGQGHRHQAGGAGREREAAVRARRRRCSSARRSRRRIWTRRARRCAPRTATSTAARGNMAQAKASLHQAQVNLDYTTIVSPTTAS